MKRLLILSIILILTISAKAQSFMFYRGEQPLDDNAEFTVTDYQEYMKLGDITVLSLESELRLKNITDNDVQATVTQTIVENPTDFVSGSLSFCFNSCYTGNVNRTLTGTISANSFSVGYHADFYVYEGISNRIKVKYTAYILDGLAKTNLKTVTVTYAYENHIPVTDVTLDRTTASLTVGNTLQLTAAVAPDNATDKNVTWTSSDPGTASVDESGNVTALAAGTAVITVTTEDGNKTATCTLTVYDDNSTELAETNINPSFNVFQEGNQLKLNYSFDSNACQLEIYNLMGQKVAQHALASGTVTFSLPERLAKSVYICTVKNNKKTITTLKFIVKY